MCDSEDLFDSFPGFQDEELPELDKIYLMFTVELGKKRCAITGEYFEQTLCLGFFLDGKRRTPVSYTAAFEHGFTMIEKDFIKLANQIDLYRSLQREMQKEKMI